MPDRFVAAARAWLGTPWVNGGRTMGVGISCTGLLIMAAREVGIAVDDIPVDEARATGRELKRQLVKYCGPVPLNCARHGDVVLMYGAPPRPGDVTPPTHLGILTQSQPRWHVIHVPRLIEGKTGWCVETRFDPVQQGARGFWRPNAFAGVES